MNTHAVVTPDPTGLFCTHLAKAARAVEILRDQMPECRREHVIDSLGGSS